jgi:Ca2+-binding RTX toxin-like protein
MLRPTGLILATMMSLGVMLLSGVALAITMTCTTTCEGTRFPDTLIGNASKNKIEGKPGADYIAGKGAADQLEGQRDNDEVRGGRGPDTILGGKHSDSDTLYGNNGNDTIIAVDEFSPGWQDFIDCGDGTDTAYVDGWTEERPDVVVNCENVVPSVCDEEVYPPSEGHTCATSMVTPQMSLTLW